MFPSPVWPCTSLTCWPWLRRAQSRRGCRRGSSLFHVRRHSRFVATACAGTGRFPVCFVCEASHILSQDFVTNHAPLPCVRSSHMHTVNPRASPPVCPSGYNDKLHVKQVPTQCPRQPRLSMQPVHSQGQLCEPPPRPSFCKERNPIPGKYKAARAPQPS